MKLLFLAPYYPHASYRFSGIFNERSACALSEFCDTVEVLVPRPYAPPLLSSLSPRWKIYRHIRRHEIRNGISVHRPGYFQIPRLGGAFWIDPGTFFWSRRTARKIHQRIGFDAIISFDLIGVGGLAWRLGQDLGIPASGWAVGGDVRFPENSSYTRVLLRAIKNLDLVFYQSQELLEKAAELSGLAPAQMSGHRHVVLPRGIPAPPSLVKTEVRNQIRSELGAKENQIIVLSIGRVVRDKGIFELLDALSLAATKDLRIICVSVGSTPDLDETNAVQKKLDQTPCLKERVRFLPSCTPDKVWEYLCAADIFAFPSHEEGMPNSLLEAMAMGVPSIAFAIPPVLEIEAGTGGLVAVPPLDSALFSEAILHLSASPDERARIGERGRAQIMERFMVRKNMAEAVARLVEVMQKRMLLQPRAHFGAARRSSAS
jgi:teichuronic acid biosynthesis glycosyltransferase TuaC